MNTIQLNIQNSVQLLDSQISELFSKMPRDLTITFPSSSLTSLSPSAVPSNPSHFIQHTTIPESIAFLKQKNRELEETMNEMEEEAEETNTQLSHAIDDLKKSRQEVIELKAQLLQARTQKVEGFSLQSLPLGEFADSVRKFQEKRNGESRDQKLKEEKKEVDENTARCQQLEQTNHMLEQVGL